MFKLFNPVKPSSDILSSKLYDENSFYGAFLKDLKKCHSEVLIESPFVSNRRLEMLLPVLIKLKSKKVRITIMTRDPEECGDSYWQSEGHIAISKLQHAGIHVIFNSGHHRKIAILDRKLLYEGSLNILSQNNSREIMRRIESVQLAWQMVRFTKMDTYIQ